MAQYSYDVVGLGNAIVDIIASVDDRFLLNHRIAKGGMTLIDEFRAKDLLKALADNRQALSGLYEVAGGSAAMYVRTTSSSPNATVPGIC